ncbi:hypothetical protein IC229_27625 [Spirosoma sp. BT702]|uniref:YopX protein domain-containing protein n=2 Tax=Spirosoma profusum TaxID=2771354 RepID=A0A927AUI2_9BACT|nr:hypothetical protein [Spirosoma profusum]
MYPVHSICFEDETITHQLDGDASIEQWDDVYESPFKFHECELLQFTGVLDCEGNKIFEGDILYYSCILDDPDEDEDPLYEHHAVIQFMHGAFGELQFYPLEPIQTLAAMQSVISEGYDYRRIIGNVFENFNLLPDYVKEKFLSEAVAV